MNQDGYRTGFGPDRLQARRHRVMGRLDGGAMVLPAAATQYKSGDSEYRYRPDNELLYLTGVEEPGAVAVLRDHADKDRFVLFVQPRDAEAERWSGPRLGPDGARERFGAEAAYPLSELDERLPRLLQGASSIHYRLGAEDGVESAVRASLAWSRRRGARTGSGPRSVVDPGQILSEMRLRKDSAEIDSIRRAADITVEGFRLLAEGIRPGAGEWELEAVLHGQFRARGGSGPAFATIVGSGANGCVLHYVANNARLTEGDLVLVDAGAEVDFYAADVTRTFPVSGVFTAEQRAVYDVVARALDAGVAAARPGQPVAGVHDAVLRVVAEGLADLGVSTESPDDFIEGGGFKAYFPHQASHWLGLDVHDPGDYATDGESRPLEPGMVLTVEPGLYFQPSVAEAAAPFRGIGIRLEDDVLVGETGPERLTGHLVAAADAVAALVARQGTGP